MISRTANSSDLSVGFGKGCCKSSNLSSTTIASSDFCVRKRSERRLAAVSLIHVQTMEQAPPSPASSPESLPNDGACVRSCLSSRQQALLRWLQAPRLQRQALESEEHAPRLGMRELLAADFGEGAYLHARRPSPAELRSLAAHLMAPHFNGPPAQGRPGPAAAGLRG